MSKSRFGGDDLTAQLQWAEQKLRYQFKDSELLSQALTHRSASRENNERLEFLGDACLNFIVANRLYELHPTEQEGNLSRFRATLVKGVTLAELGRELDLAPLLILGPGENSSGGGNRDSILADSVEAVIGSIFLDGGFQAANRCVRELFETRLRKLPDAASLKDAKTRLQEWLQGRGLSLPVYTVESVSGEAHRQSFTIICEASDPSKRVEGRGSSRRHGEQDAAEKMLLILESDQE